MTTILFVCTGNAARSVMAGAMFERLVPGWTVATAGTHVVEGQPMSRRTAQALDRLGFAAPGHRSRQLTMADLARADLVVTFERFHVAYVRSMRPGAAGSTSTMPELVRRLPSVVGSLSERLEALYLAGDDVAGLEEVDDPAGADPEVVAACARVILELTLSLAATLEQTGDQEPTSSETLRKGQG